MSYKAKDIKALTDREHLLQRMSLTFGAEGGNPDYPFSTQKTVAIREIIDNAEDEVSAGHATKVFVKFSKDNSITIMDNGRGLPVDIGRDAFGQEANGIFLCLGVIKSGGKFGKDKKRYSKGLNGVGSSSTVATAKRTDVEVYRDGKIYKLSFQDGKPGVFNGEGADAPFTPYNNNVDLIIEKDNRSKQEKSNYKTGTKVQVWLNDSVYTSPYPVDIEDLIKRLRGSAFLLPSIVTEVVNEHNVDENGNIQHEIFHFDNGLGELVELNQAGVPLINTVELKSTGDYTEVVYDNELEKTVEIDREVVIDLGFSYDSGYDYNMESFVNTIRTRLGGVHELAFEKALVNSFGDKIMSTKGLMPKDMSRPIIEDFKEGLTAVLSVYISEPQFTGQAKEELGGKEVQKSIFNSLIKTFNEYIADKKNQLIVNKICEKVANASIIRQNARAERDLERIKKSVEGNHEMPEKLVDCKKVYTENSELYIAEGDSAKGAIKAARNPEFQAILPIRGKITNSSKISSVKALLLNQEVQSIIKALGAGSQNSFKMENARYQRVFLATDADADGGAISCLLILLFWELFRPLVLEGRLFQLQTPLFVINMKSTKKGLFKEKYYALTDEEKDSIVLELENKGATKKDYTIARIKGLGECPEDVLFETGLNPETRVIKQIVVNDIEKAQEMLEITMGKDTDKRKEWLANRNINSKELDAV